MTSFEKDCEKVRSLHHGQHCVVNWFEEGGGEVYLIWDTLFLFYVPQYGGSGRFEKSFHETEIESLVSLAHTWN